MKPNDPSFALMQKAVALHLKGQLVEAEQGYLDILKDFENPDTLRLLGGLYLQTNKPAQAEVLFAKALQLNPDQPELLNNMGVTCYSQGQRDKAEGFYKQALQQAPDYAGAVHNLANLYHAEGKWDDAILWFERFLELKPDTTDILKKLGDILREQGKSAEACAAYERLAQLQPDDITIQLNLGTIYHDLGRFEDSLAQFDKTLERHPQSADALLNRASILMELNRPDEAQCAYNQSLEVKPDFADAKWGKALALLMLGQYEPGWALYENRFHRPALRGVGAYVKPGWDGGDLQGKTLLIWGEQGFGDVLQFIRYAELCKKKGGTIIVQCGEPLVRLLENCPFIDRAVTDIVEKDFDCHAAVMSLPRLFGTVLETIPQNIPYLFVSDEARKRWAPCFADHTAFRIGLVWAGNPRKTRIEAHITDRQRSLNLTALKPLLALPNCQSYTLQKDGGDYIARNNLNGQLIDLMPEVQDFMDTAAIIENLDLVISVDTSVVHLAGGLGKPVWVLSRFAGCWRWLRNRELNPWYPTARIFGQPTPGDWDSVIQEVTAALSAKLTS